MRETAPVDCLRVAKIAGLTSAISGGVTSICDEVYTPCELFGFLDIVTLHLKRITRNVCLVSGIIAIISWVVSELKD